MLLYQFIPSGKGDHYFAAFQDWFEKRGVDFRWVKDSQGRRDCVQVYRTILDEKLHFAIDFHPSHQNLAMLFKLTWSGRCLD